MMRFDKAGIIKNVSSSWLGLIVNVVTGIIISPYILHRLGDDAFGLWVLVFAITGYYGLFDFGIRSSVVRFVAKYSAVGDQEQLNRIVNTSLLSYGCLGLFLLGLTAIGTFFVDRIFHVPVAYVGTARILFFIVGSSLAVGFPFAVFTGILEGLQKFYLPNLINITTTLLRAVLIVVVLNHGFGLLAVALITAVVPLINSLVNAINVFRITQVRFNLRLASAATFRQIFNYSSVTFMISLATRLRFKTDALVIGSFLSAAAITQFAIASRLVDYASDFVDSLAQIFVPMSSHLEATGDMERLRKVYVAGNQACALIIFPICAGLIILGKSVIEVWMGAKYIASSYPVLLILLIPATLRMAQATSGRILFGIARHKALAWVTLTEGLLNLALSIALVRPFGIVGDALGTAIPLTLTCVLFLPYYLCHLLGLRIRTFLLRAYSLPLALCLPMVAVLLLLQRWFVPHTLVQLIGQTVVGGLVYAALVYSVMFVRGRLGGAKLRTEGQSTEPIDGEALVMSSPTET
jgi:O-antigen/teichoic acid export membrane protein